MPWGEVNVEEQRNLFAEAYFKGIHCLAKLCRQFKISRPTGYHWLKRYKKEGKKGLKNQSKARKTQPNATDPKLVDEILAVKFKYPDLGPDKVLGYLEYNRPTIHWPSSTTIEKLFKKNGLVLPRKYRKRMPVQTTPLAHCQQLNDVWCVDFKGWFLTRDGHKCEPFTLTDAHSRYLLRCLKLNANDTNHVWAVLEMAFREYGLPRYMRSDNGPPFATSCAGRISPLSVKLIKAGVIPEWIEPGNPQQNGRHERMHLTLKNEGIFPAVLSLEEQLMKFQEFQHYYNFVRPHEALGQVPPGSLYQPSQRVWDGRLKSPEYPNATKVGRVRSCGTMCWKGGVVYISRTLSEEPVGLQENEEGYKVYYGPIILGILTRKNEFIIERRKPRRIIPTKKKPI